MSVLSQRDPYRIDLAGYMDTCDRNYRRILHLIPALDVLRPSRSEAEKGRVSPQAANASLTGASWRFLVSGGRLPQSGTEMHSGTSAADPEKPEMRREPTIRVDIRVVESFAYTTTLEMTVAGFPVWASAPRMQVRLYHDADTAEPLAYQGHRRIPVRSAIPNKRMYHQDEKRQINEFLAEWLELCLRFGARAPTRDTLCTT